MNVQPWIRQLGAMRPKIHCITNPVTMEAVANILLAAGGSAIMGQDPAEAAEVTSLCAATLLNTGVPDENKFRACLLAGQRANELGHPVVLDPVGAGASRFRREGLENILKGVRISLIRCNQEEACTLLSMKTEENADRPNGSGAVIAWQLNGASDHGGGADDSALFHRGARISSGGVESAVAMGKEQADELARRLARAWSCTVLISGEEDVISDGGSRIVHVGGGDPRMSRVTGAGCMLSALCALFCGAGLSSFDAGCAASAVWKESARLAGQRIDQSGGGIGSFRVALFDAVDSITNEKVFAAFQNCMQDTKNGKEVKEK